MINNNDSVTPINEEEEITNMQYLDEMIDIFPDETNNEDWRNSENRPKR